MVVIVLLMGQVRAVRKEINYMEESEYECVRKILRVWKQLKDVRSSQGYCSTGVRLVVHR